LFQLIGQAAFATAVTGLVFYVTILHPPTAGSVSEVPSVPIRFVMEADEAIVIDQVVHLAPVTGSIDRLCFAVLPQYVVSDLSTKLTGFTLSAVYVASPEGDALFSPVPTDVSAVQPTQVGFPVQASPCVSLSFPAGFIGSFIGELSWAYQVSVVKGPE
jgi:hypothetical protein